MCNGFEKVVGQEYNKISANYLWSVTVGGVIVWDSALGVGRHKVSDYVNTLALGIKNQTTNSYQQRI